MSFVKMLFILCPLGGWRLHCNIMHQGKHNASLKKAKLRNSFYYYYYCSPSGTGVLCVVILMDLSLDNNIHLIRLIKGCISMDIID